MSRTGRRYRSLVAAGVAIALMTAAAACGDDDDDDTTDAGEEPAEAGGMSPGDIHLFYLQKQADQDYFQGEARGAKEKADELGIEITMVDLGNDTSKTLDEVSSAIGQGASGIIIVVPDASVGPAVVEATDEAEIPLLTSDDQVCRSSPDPAECPDGDLIPRVGFSGTQMGEEVGTKAAELFQETDWDPAETRIIAAWKQDLTVCTDRVDAALPSFETASGEEIEVIEVGTDNTPPDAEDKVGAVVTANPDVKHWIIWGCNDENVVGGVNALESAGFGPDHVIGVGINGDLACQQWTAGAETGVKATLWLNGAEVGALSVESMFNKLTDGTDFEAEAFARTNMLTPETHEDEGAECG